MMISEFMHTDPMKFLPEDGSLQLTAGWTGDVKYHLGGIKTTDSYGTMQRIALANNPSHLEIVAPVVEGRTRAAQDDTQRAGAPTTDHHKAMPIIIHGDAAYPGQGINFETMNLGNLKGYSTGGSLHIITNNRIDLLQNQLMHVQQLILQMWLKVMMCQYSMSMQMTLKLLLKQLILQWNLEKSFIKTSLLI